MNSNILANYANTPLGQIHYREIGSGPPIILLHESPISGQVYNAALPAIGKRARAISPDTPGYGASDPPPEPLTIAGYAERIALFINSLQLKKIALVGNHTGGSIAVQIAISHPEMVHSLIVIGCPLYEEEEVQERLDNYLEPFVLFANGSHLQWVWDRYKRIWGEDSPLDLIQLATTEFLRTGSRYDWAYQAAFKFDIAKVLPKITCPTLFLVTEGDILRNKNEAAVKLTPGAKGEVIDSPFGQLPARHPDIFAKKVFSFLEETGYL